MEEALLAGAVTGWAVAVPVGAVGVYLVALTARTSLRVGVPAALGVATTDGLYALLAALGGSALAAALAPVQRPLAVTAAVVLLVVAVTGVLRAVRDHREALGATAGPGRRGLTPLRAYVALVVITAVNPATVVFFVAVVLGRHDVLGSAGDRVAFALAAFAASASWQLVVVSGGAALGRVLTGPRGRLATSLVSSTVVAGLAVSMLV